MRIRLLIPATVELLEDANANEAVLSVGAAVREELVGQALYRMVTTRDVDPRRPIGFVLSVGRPEAYPEEPTE